MKSVVINWPMYGPIAATIQDEFNVKNGVIYDRMGRRRSLNEFIRDPANTWNLIYIGTMDRWTRFQKGLIGRGQPRPANSSLTAWPDHGPDWPGPPPYSAGTINFVVADISDAALSGATIQYGTEPPQTSDGSGQAAVSGMLSGKKVPLVVTKAGFKPMTFDIRFFGPTFHFHWQMAAAT